MWMWIIGGIVVLLILIVIGVVVFEQGYKKETARIMEEGEKVLCWLVVANDNLYEPIDEGNASAYSFAQVVFTFDDSIKDLHETLEEWSENLKSYKPPKNPNDDERIIGQVMRTHIPYFRPLRLPKKITGGIKGYTVSVHVFWGLLPEGYITRPYIYCKVLLGSGGGARMVHYPKKRIKNTNQG